MKRVKELFINDLFEPQRVDSDGRILFVRVFEIVIVSIGLFYLWKWAFYIPKLGEVILPLGIANYIDMRMMFNEWFPYITAAAGTLGLVLALTGKWRHGYTFAFIFWHIQYAARFSQGEISHGSNMAATGLFSFALAHSLFDDAQERRKFAIGMLTFFVGLGYTSAACSKLIGTGLTWVDGSHLWIWMGERSTDRLSQDGFFEFNMLQNLAFSSHFLSTLILIFGLTAELFGFLFWFKKTRPYIALLLIGMHIGILISMNISFDKYVYIMVLLGFNWSYPTDYLLRRFEQTKIKPILHKLTLLPN